jgi:hypothetical protein
VRQKILNEYGAVQSELIGKVVVLTDGKAGTVENVWLDELHGLRIVKFVPISEVNDSFDHLVASDSNAGGTVMPSAFAVLRLITK